MSLAKTVGEWAAASITVATILQWLPALTAIGAVVWYAIQIWEKIHGKPFSESSLAKWLRGEK
jgi:hypothetical protein